MIKKLCRLNQRYYWQRNFLLEQISSHISFIVTFCEPFLFPDIALYTIGTVVTRTSLRNTVIFVQRPLYVGGVITGRKTKITFFLPVFGHFFEFFKKNDYLRNEKKEYRRKKKLGTSTDN